MSKLECQYKSLESLCKILFKERLYFLFSNEPSRQEEERVWRRKGVTGEDGPGSGGCRTLVCRRSSMEFGVGVGPQVGEGGRFRGFFVLVLGVFFLGLG